MAKSKGGDIAMDFEFTQADEKHIPELVDLVNSAYRGESSKKGWTTEADLLDGQRTDGISLKESLQGDGSVILIAQHNDTDKIHGCVHLAKENERCYLGMLTVDPHLQSRGLGKLLLQEAEAFAQFWDCTKIYMTVIASRSELIAWYERHGYQRTTETKKFPYGDERFGIPKTQDLYFIVLEKNI